MKKEVKEGVERQGVLQVALGEIKEVRGGKVDPSIIAFWPCPSQGRKLRDIQEGLTDVGPRKAEINNSES